MESPIEGSGQAIGAILGTGPRLSVPYFQRGYAWQREHVERLLGDLVEHSVGPDKLGWYPLGAIILATAEGGDTVAITDGHQRLVSLTLLLAVLRDLETDTDLRRRLASCILDAEGRPRLTTLEATRSTFLKYVQLDGATSRHVEPDETELSLSEEAIIENRDWLRDGLVAMSAEARRGLAGFVLDQTFVVVISVADEKAARLLFTTMHETGVRPQITDLLKSQVLGRLAGEPRSRAQVVWEDIEARLGRERMEVLIRHISAIKMRRISGERADFGLASAFDLSNPAAAESFVFEHLRPIGSCHLDILRAGTDGTAEPGPVMRRLQYLGWVVRHDTWQLPALHWLVRTTASDEQTFAFLRRLEALAWMQMIRAEEAQRRDRRYLALLDEIDRGRALEKGGALEISVEEISKVREILSGPNLFRRPYKLFLLLRLNAISEGEQAVRVAPVATVEHIYPQRPAKSSAWLGDFADAELAGRLCHSLGNLTLLTEAEQNRAQNQDFLAKRRVYAESSFTLSKALAGREMWRPDDIEARTQSLIDELFRSFGIA